MRLIDADALWDELTEDLGDGDVLYRIPPNAIDDAPTVDAVPVVRCKDCKHYEMGVCLKIYSDGNVSKDAWQRRKPVDFCSYGERKDGGDSDAVD